jgi:hypothetical protein
LNIVIVRLRVNQQKGQGEGGTDVRVERRGNRLVPAPCAACGRDELRVMLRTGRGETANRKSPCTL